MLSNKKSQIFVEKFNCIHKIYIKIFHGIQQSAKHIVNTLFLWFIKPLKLYKNKLANPQYLNKLQTGMKRPKNKSRYNSLLLSYFNSQFN